MLQAIASFVILEQSQPSGQRKSVNIDQGLTVL